MTPETEYGLKQRRDQEQGDIRKLSTDQCGQAVSEPYPLRARLENQRNQLTAALRRLDNQIAFVQEHPEIEGLGFGLSNQIGY